MVDALREATRVLRPTGVLIDVRPVIAPIVVEVVMGTQVLWTKTVESYSAPEDIAAADSAVHYGVSREWIVFESRLPFDFDICCDSTDELRVYAEARNLHGAEIPYRELDERRSASAADGQMARLRCRRPWMLSIYRKHAPPVRS